ncbi:hypothetical protein [Desertivirga brevis]|uniref:hypothetical protein n=1 Tax=Desertivirga brevis TaxID=2810310 RepID=UPI001A95AD07|nr:hypothetical protein [Pedobacter sp. SYSU D00873]
MTKTSSQLVKFTKDLIHNVAGFDDIIDKALEPVKDYTDTLADLVAPFKSLLSLISLRRKLSLKAFLTNYSRVLSQDYTIDEKETEQLEKYLSKEENLHFVTEVIEKGVQARSIKSSAVLGIMAGSILREKRELNLLDLILIDSLAEMNDIDMQNFMSLIEGGMSIRADGKLELDEEYRTRDIYQEDSWGLSQLSRESLEITIEKLKRTEALSFGEGGIGSVGNARGAFVFTAATEELFRIIESSGVMKSS